MAKMGEILLVAMALMVDCATETEALATRIVLDDGDETVVSEVQNIFPDSSECAANAHNGHFRHDLALNKGSAFFTFKFDPPADGCYAVEEYHPTGLSSVASCSRHFPKNARLDIDYCKDKSATLFIDQTANAAQWNEIAHFMFYRGNEGRLTLRSSEAEQCEVDMCFLAVDAFRLTWKGASCSSNTESGSTEDEALDAEKEGVMSLRLKLAAGQSVATVQPVLDIHKTGIARTMASPLGYKYVSILSLTVSGRRLMEVHETFKLRFGVKGKVAELNEDSLAQVLQEFLGGLLPGLTVLDAKVDWSDGTAGEGSSDWVGYVVLVGILGLLGGLVSLGLVWKCTACCLRQRKHEESKSTGADPAEDAEKAFEKIGKDEFGEVASTDSTGTPDSEQQASEDSGSKQGRDSPPRT